MQPAIAPLEPTIDSFEALFSSGDVQRLKQLALTGELRGCPYRSIAWRVFLGCIGEDPLKWRPQVTEQRQKYEALKAEYIIDPHSVNASVDPEIDNPLSESDSSIWKRYFQNEELQKEINQDIVRTYPENDFFQENHIRNLMLRILFIFAREHPEISYRQGMHELLAPIVYVLGGEKKEKVEGNDNLLDFLVLGDFMEHDAFCMFTFVMKVTAPWFLPSTSKIQATNSVVRKCRNIQYTLLKEKDPVLHDHLQALNIEPQLYALRWVRLLLGREFHLHDVLVVWDGLFAFSKDLSLIDYICVAMLIYVREQLLINDSSGCLRRLFRFPPVEDVRPFIQKAIELTTKEPFRPFPQALANPSPISPSTSINIETQSSGNIQQVQSTPQQTQPQHAQQLSQPQLSSSPLSQSPPVVVKQIPIITETPKVAVVKKKTLEDWRAEATELRRTQVHMAARLERIIYILQKELMGSSSLFASSNEMDSILLALAELKQVKDILGGFLPNDCLPTPFPEALFTPETLQHNVTVQSTNILNNSPPKPVGPSVSTPTTGTTAGISTNLTT